MKKDEFRRLALGLPEAIESAHMGHPDFRVGGRIFATLGPADEEWGMVNLPLDRQAALVREHPGVFQPAAGAWGRRGATIVSLPAVRASILRPALAEAWRRTAPKRIAGPDPPGGR